MNQQIANNAVPCISRSSEETHSIAKAFGSALPNHSIIAFSGDLGAGKTTFIRGLSEGAAAIDPRQVSSPTFTFLHIYEGLKTIYHFDLYRLPSEEEFLSSGFHDYFEAEGICCIEWAEKIPSYLPKIDYHIDIAHAGKEMRNITIRKSP